MERFRSGERVVVTEPRHELCGARGTVARLNVANGGAVVRIHGGLPDEIAHTIGGRVYRDETVLFPDQCERLR